MAHTFTEAQEARILQVVMDAITRIAHRHQAETATHPPKKQEAIKKEIMQEEVAEAIAALSQELGVPEREIMVHIWSMFLTSKH